MPKKPNQSKNQDKPIEPIEPIKNKERKNLQSDVNLTTIAAYKRFVKETKRTDISFEVYKKIPDLVHERMLEKLYSQSYYIKVPEFGTIRLIKVKPFKKSEARVDWKHYMKTGERIFIRNSHTNGYMFKIQLYMNYKKNPLLSCFDFYLARNNKKTLASLIFSNKIK
jgi:hypothetical protein